MKRTTLKDIQDEDENEGDLDGDDEDIIYD